MSIEDCYYDNNDFEKAVETVENGGSLVPENLTGIVHSDDKKPTELRVYKHPDAYKKSTKEKFADGSNYNGWFDFPELFDKKPQ